jgi:hypothetical protein
MNDSTAPANNALPISIYYEIIEAVVKKFPTTKRILNLWSVGIIFGLYIVATIIAILLSPADWLASMFVATVLLILLSALVVVIIQFTHARGEQQIGKEPVEWCSKLLKDKEAEYHLNLQTITVLEETAELYSGAHENKPALLNSTLLVVTGAVLTWSFTQDFIVRTTRDLATQATAWGLLITAAVLVLLLIIPMVSLAENMERRNANLVVRVAIKIWKAEKSALNPDHNSQ